MPLHVALPNTDAKIDWIRRRKATPLFEARRHGIYGLLTIPPYQFHDLLGVVD
jgi:hypothetical protein